MTAHNSTSTYGSVAKTFHWLTALLIISAFPLGMLANNAPFANGEEIARKAMLFSLHKTIGVTAFFTALARILWAISQQKPALLNAENKPEAFVAEAIHWLLYISMLMVPLSGWLYHSASTGVAPIWLPFGQSLPFVPKSAPLAELFKGGHFVFTKLLLAAVALHVAGALKHALIDRDQTLRRMLPGRADIPDLPPHSPDRKPLMAALALFAVAMGLGVMIGRSTIKVEPVSRLESVSSGWTVSGGSIAITITQFGNEITGTFPDFTAAIEFNPDLTTSTIGHVDATINIAGLDLGTLTPQALGADFFDSGGHPTASFQADIEHADADYIANGTLTLKGVALPVSLPFSLIIENGIATMNGQLALNRIDYGIGKSLPDESALNFTVGVNINLTATRADP